MDDYSDVLDTLDPQQVVHETDFVLAFPQADICCPGMEVPGGCSNGSTLTAYR
jgi:hypothetical protein